MRQRSKVILCFMPFLILSLGGIIWTMFAFLVLAPRMLLDFWFERGIGVLVYGKKR